MPALNKVILIGHLGRDPELRATPGGAFVAKFCMAISRSWKNKSGELQKETTWVNITAWQKEAETIAKFFHKGDPILIEGRLQSRSWETDDGQKRSALDVVCERFQFMKPKGEDRPQSNREE